MSIVAQWPQHLSAGMMLADGGRRKHFAGSKPVRARGHWDGALSPVIPNRVVITDASSLHIQHPGIASSLDFIFKNHQSAISVKDLVRVARMSRRGFLKAFLKHTGNSPGRMLRAVRLERARQLLVRTTAGPEMIALDCGFRSLNSFMVSFKREGGISPVQFRRQALRLLEMCGENKNHDFGPLHNFQSALQKP